LKKLSLRFNDVYDLEPLLALPRLESLDLAGNPVSANDPILKKLQKKMKVNLHVPVETPVMETEDAPGLNVDGN
jgi:Leucine-rich repeat (LRR) protein